MATETLQRRTVVVQRIARLLPAAIVPPMALALAFGDGQYESTWYPAGSGSWPRSCCSRPPAHAGR